MTEEQIDHMVHQFMDWKLPEYVDPMKGAKDPRYPNRSYDGSHLLHHSDVRAMVLHMLEGLPADKPDPAEPEAMKEARSEVEQILRKTLADVDTIDGIVMVVRLKDRHNTYACWTQSDGGSLTFALHKLEHEIHKAMFKD